jgi:hypothetical protein
MTEQTTCIKHQTNIATRRFINKNSYDLLRTRAGNPIPSARVTKASFWNHFVNNLRAVVEVVPMVAGANPIVIGGGIVGLVVGVSRRVVQLAGLGVLAGGLGVESSSGLTVESLEHLQSRID